MRKGWKQKNEPVKVNEAVADESEVTICRPPASNTSKTDSLQLVGG